MHFALLLIDKLGRLEVVRFSTVDLLVLTSFQATNWLRVNILH